MKTRSRSTSFGDLRQEIYNRFHARGSRFAEHMTSDKDRYAAYYTAMYLLQDTYDATYVLGQKELSDDPLIAYIEVWGLLQALVIAQDAMTELYKAVTGNKYDADRHSPSWWSVRDLRNEVAGHPARKDRKGGREIPPIRSFWGRGGYSLSCFHYERFNMKTRRVTHPQRNLKKQVATCFERDGRRILGAVLDYIDKNYESAFHE